MSEPLRLRVIEDDRNPPGTRVLIPYGGEIHRLLYLGPSPRVPRCRPRRRARARRDWQLATEAALERYEIEYSPFGIPEWAVERTSEDVAIIAYAGPVPREDQDPADARCAARPAGGVPAHPVRPAPDTHGRDRVP